MPVIWQKRNYPWALSSIISLDFSYHFFAPKSPWFQLHEYSTLMFNSLVSTDKYIKEQNLQRLTWRCFCKSSFRAQRWWNVKATLHHCERFFPHNWIYNSSKNVTNCIKSFSENTSIDTPPGKKDVEGPPWLLASCTDPMNIVTILGTNMNSNL